MNQQINSPEVFFGFQLGSDHKLARWDKIVEYFQLLAQESNRIQVVDMGTSTEGNPFLLAIISSPQNLSNLAHLREVNSNISDPRGFSEASVKGLVREGVAVICLSMGLHASEIGSTQMASELAYDLLTKTDEETQRILDNVLFLMFPCLNPDGQIMVTDWYNEHLNTEYEGCGLPWLYHKYAGHDNNRDAFMLNLVESQYVARILFQEWHPQVYQDHHEMGSYGARLYVVPYCEPIHPHADPLIWREINWCGAHMVYRLEEAGKTGVINAALFPAWSHLGFHWIGNYHNIASLLTESAHTKLATPMYIHKSQLQGGGGTLRGFPHYKPQTNFPHPWPGGWWRLRDIVEQQKVAAWGLLDLAARHKDTVLWNAYLKAKRQTERGASGKPVAYLICPTQHDSLTVVKLINKVLSQGIDIQQAEEDFTVNGLTYPAGTYVIPLNQPKMGIIKTLLGRTLFPDDAWTRRADGSPNRPYDTATDTIAELMGVHVEPVNTLACDTAIFAPITAAVGVASASANAGQLVGESEHGYLFDGRLNDSFTVVNQLLGQGLRVCRVDQAVTVGDKLFPPGAFVVAPESEETLRTIGSDSGVTFYALEAVPEAKQHEVKQLRVGMYQRYRGGNMDEGWTRLVLEQFGFPYQTLRDDDIKAGDENETPPLHQRVDVLILPSDSTAMIVGQEEDKEEEESKEFDVPPGYRSGIGTAGVKAIKQFVENGGTLVTLNHSCEFAIEKLGLRVRNVLKGKPSKEFFCPGSTLKAHIDTNHPLAYGMPEEALIFFWDSPTFEVLPSRFNERYDLVIEYHEKDILRSGWLVGEAQIAEKAAMISAQYGAGRVLLFGFRPQHRAQTHGTFKLLFNALIR